MYSCQIPNFNTISLKRVMDVNASFEKVREYFTNYDNLKKTDEKILEFEVVEELAKNTKLCYQVFEGSFLVSNRDF